MASPARSITIQSIMNEVSANDNLFPEWILGILRCPNSGTSLAVASAKLIGQLSDRYKQSGLTNKIGRSVLEIPTQGLVSTDGRWFYGVHQGIPCLLPDEAIELDPKFNSES